MTPPLRLFVACVLICVVNCVEQTKCKSEKDENGVCLQLTECPSAYVSVMRTRSHNMSRCGFEGYVEIVCCTDSEVVGTATEGEGDVVWGFETPNPTAPEPVVKAGNQGSIVPTKPTQTRGPLRKYEQACEEYATQASLNVHFNILGGEQADEGEFPHMVALGYPDDDNQFSWQCGGSLISKQYVLTAAHCIINPDNIRPQMARIGSILLEGWSDSKKPQDIPIMNITTHPNYTRRWGSNDIALIRLAQPIETNSNVNPACLYTKMDDPQNIGLIVTGWGNTDSEMINRSNILLKATLRPVELETCRNMYRRFNRSLTNKQLCAGSTTGQDSCKGDSGGPLQLFTSQNVWAIAGIISFGPGCGGATPAVYTRVASYLDWIENIVWVDT